MSKLVINAEKCTSCRTCEVVCSFGQTNSFNPRSSAVTVKEDWATLTSEPLMCTQCDEAPCLDVCPVDALSRDGSGVVKLDAEACIVCEVCIDACPHGSIRLSPDNAIVKCNLCDGEPKCVKFCAAGALEFA